MTDDKKPPETAAQAWAEWAQDFGESSSNPPIGSWRALKDCFLGGMYMALVMIGHHRASYEYAKQLFDELREMNHDEALPIDEWVKAGSDDELTLFTDYLMKATDQSAAEVWDLLDRDEEGAHQLPELGFAPELGTAMAALRTIAERDQVPRPENTRGEPTYSLATDMGTLAMAAIWHIRQMAKHRMDDKDEQ